MDGSLQRHTCRSFIVVSPVLLLLFAILETGRTKHSIERLFADVEVFAKRLERIVLVT